MISKYTTIGRSRTGSLIVDKQNLVVFLLILPIRHEDKYILTSKLWFISLGLNITPNPLGNICLISLSSPCAILNNPMNWDNETKRFIIHRLKWLLIFMGVGIILVSLLPFPYDFISIAGLFVLMTYLRNRSEMKRFGGGGGVRNLFNSFSSAMSDNQSRSLKYYCMSCGKEHKEIACPNCGSKMKRVG